MRRLLVAWLLVAGSRAADFSSNEQLANSNWRPYAPYCRCRHSFGQADLGQPALYLYGVGRTNSMADPQGSRHRSSAPRQGTDRRRTGQDHRHASTRVSWWKARFAVRSSRTSPGCAKSAATVACRHRRALPVRGQRTRRNARTRKGPRKTVAGKKGVKELGK